MDRFPGFVMDSVRQSVERRKLREAIVEQTDKFGPDLTAWKTSWRVFSEISVDAWWHTHKCHGEVDLVLQPLFTTLFQTLWRET